MTSVELLYKCECCKCEFTSHRARSGEKLCVTCIELRRAMKSFLKQGLSSEELLKRGRKLLIGGKKQQVVAEE